MLPGEKVRIDKWLYAIRLFKTRSLAAEFCDRQRVAVADHLVKPSRMVKQGDIITLSRTGFKQVFEVLNLTDKRLSAKLVPDYCKDITPQEELDKIALLRLQRGDMRERGRADPRKEKEGNSMILLTGEGFIPRIFF